MKIAMCRKQHGISLLEILLVIALAALVLTFAMQQYQRLRWKQHAQVVMHSVGYLSQGLQHYYVEHCTGNNKCADGITQVTYQDLIAELPKSLQGAIVNPWAQNANQPYFAQIDIKKLADNKELVHLKIFAPMDKSPEVVAGLRQRLNASTREGNTLIWQWFPHQRDKLVASPLWIMNGGLDHFKQELS